MELQHGTVLTYKSLREILGGLNPQSHAGRAMVLSVGQRLEREGQRALQNIRGIGYQIAHPGQHLGIGEKRQQRGRRQVAAAMRVLLATPVSALSTEQRRRHDAYLVIIQQQVDAMRSVQAKAAQAYKQIDAEITSHLISEYNRIEALKG